VCLKTVNLLYSRARWRGRPTMPVAIVVVATVVAGCGGASSSSQGKLAKIDTCLRSEGVVVSGTGTGELTPGMSPKRLAAALKKCGVRGGTFSGAEQSGPTSSAKRIVVERELVKQVTCLQEHGFHVTATKNVEQQLFNANGVNTKSVRFRAANRECRQKFVEAIRKLGHGYAPGEGSEPNKSGTSAPQVPSRQATARTACLRGYGATAVGTGALSGLKVPRGTTPAQLSAMLKNCGSGSARPEAKRQSFRSLAVAKVVACLHEAGVQIPPSDSDLLSSTSGIKTRSPRVKAAIGKCRSESLSTASR
jgi:hypothetical protein